MKMVLMYGLWSGRIWINVKNGERKRGLKCDILETQHLPPTNHVACPHETLHWFSLNSWLLELSLAWLFFSNKSSHDLRYLRGSWFLLWLILACQPWMLQMMVLVLTTFFLYMSFCCKKEYLKMFMHWKWWAINMHKNRFLLHIVKHFKIYQCSEPKRNNN